jgi:uncharacterized protein YjbI with pentapeptide repeats
VEVAARASAAVLLVVAVGVSAWVVAGPGALWVLHHLDNINSKTLTSKETADALDAIRGRALAIATGLAALVAVSYTATNARTARRTLAHSQDVARATQEAARLTHEHTVETAHRTAELTEQGQVTDRYTKAIEQLGSDKPDVRLGGIYALERIARDSARDHPTVIEVLVTFFREHLADKDARISPSGPGIQQAGRVGRPRLRSDLRAAVRVIGRRDHDQDAHRPALGGLNLSGLDLSEVNLSYTDLSWTDLSGTGLIHADLSCAELHHVDLSNADLRAGTRLIEAQLFSANLSGANLSGAILLNANLTKVSLRGADLTVANLNRASLVQADLTEAVLHQANLAEAILSGANLANAVFTTTNLTNAELANADLSGTNLMDANVTGADFTGAINADLTGTIGTPRVPPPVSGTSR